MSVTSTEKTGTRLLLSGNEALALGAFEAGVRVASAYPGTPSTEILEHLSTYEGVYAEWAPNEKVALEVALGASFAGVRALATMKHVGLNVAADPLFTAAYTGVRGGLVVVTADDPSMHSSQNEQDNRNYAFAAKVPMLEPADAAEAKEFLKRAFELSEEFDTPVLLRTTTRIAHVKGLLEAGPRTRSGVEPGIVKMPQKFVMLPAHARARRVEVEHRMKRLTAHAEDYDINRIEWGNTDRGFITSGISYLYVKEAFPDASVLKLGMVHPLPEGLIRSFAERVEEVVVVEELDPFMELQVKAMGIACRGKELIPAIGELNTAAVRSGVLGIPADVPFKPVDIPLRPPNMCPGCPHRGLFHVLSKLKVFISGDIGCYTLGALKPLSAMDSCVCMGASVGGAHGMEKALGDEAVGRVVAVIGDSTFIHSGITPLIDIVYNQGASTVIILDNRTTAMTGHQANPASGTSITGEPAPMLDLEALCRAVGVSNVRVVNPHDLKETRGVLKEELEKPEPSVVITRAPCALLPEHRRTKRHRYAVTTENCQGCRACVGLGCPAIEWVPLTREEAAAMGFKEKQKGHSRISGVLCDGCGQCHQLCKFGAINPEESP
jgi:indolepyruvate ferredoxin oxidoreductase alpha subunit